MFLFLGALVVTATILAAVGDTGWSVAFFALASVWSGWAAFANAVIGCWKCVSAWLLMILFSWAVFAWAQSPHTRYLAWSLIGGGILGVIIQMIQNQTRSSTVQRVS